MLVCVIGNNPSAVGSDTVWPLYEWRQFFFQVIQATLRSVLDHSSFHLNYASNPRLTLRPQTIEQQLLQVQREHHPASGDQIRAQVLDLAAQLELVLRLVLN